MINTKEEIEEYLKFLKEYNFKYITDEVLEIITDADELYDYSIKNNKKLGIIYKSKWHIFVIDLVKDKKGKYYTYERLINTIKGNCVVVIPKFNNKFVLLKQFRHALGEYQYCFPRGFGEPMISAKENAIKEINEELNTYVYDADFLGKIVADSGVCGEKVNVFLCQIAEPHVIPLYEEIVEYILVTEEELNIMIKKNKINDSFTLSALLLYKSGEA